MLIHNNDSNLSPPDPIALTTDVDPKGASTFGRSAFLNTPHSMVSRV
jgi:hypothetical protein